MTSVIFADTSTWYRTINYEDWQNKTNGTEIDVSDPVTAAGLLMAFDYDGNEFYYYYWYKL